MNEGSRGQPDFFPPIAGPAAGMGGPDKPTRVPLLRWTNGLVNRIVTLGDLLVMSLASLIPFPAHTAVAAQSTWQQTLLLAMLEAAVLIKTLRVLGSYRTENYEKLRLSLPDLLPGLLVAWVVGTIYNQAFHGDFWGADGLWYCHLRQFAALVAARILAGALLRQGHRHAFLRRTVAIVGANDEGEAILARMLSPQERRNYDVIGVFADATDPHRSGTMLGVPIMGDMDALGAYANRHVIDLVVVALPFASAIERVVTVEHLQWMATDVVIPVADMRMPTITARVSNIADVEGLQVLHRPLKGSQALFKIIEDYVIAGIVLLLISPLLLFVALLIKLDSKGPVFFRQERTGFNNNGFKIFKFRTMTVDLTDDGSVGLQRRDDPRITRVGGILRRLSIDELPQLINVLLGDMSIVGPRPYVPNMLVENERFRSAVQNYAFRFRLKPGITGLAQASGFRSNALRNMANARRSIELDIEYIERWSIWLDLQIMVRTVLVALSGPDVF